MPDTTTIYLDVETDWSRRLTLVGFRGDGVGLIQLVGDDITPDRLRNALPRRAVLYTYNGHCFDLPIIRDQLGLDLRDTFDSRDLRWICQRHGPRGGQKAIEQQLGLARALEGLDGRDAIRLWDRYRRHGDGQALADLLSYNAEDLDGLVAIRDHLLGRGVLTAS